MTKIEKAKYIWKNCFQDSEEETNFYFEKHNGNIIVRKIRSYLPYMKTPILLK